MNNKLKIYNMKTIKYLLLMNIMLFFSCAKAQELNNISKENFYNIQFNGVKLNDIINKQKAENTIQSLFTETVFSEIKDIAGSTNVISRVNGCRFQFESLQEVGENSFDITFASINETAVIKINGIDISIGDNITKLGNVTLNNTEKMIIFSQKETTSSLDIKYIEAGGQRVISEIRMIFY
jgi:hypothetical protein